MNELHYFVLFSVKVLNDQWEHRQFYACNPTLLNANLLNPKLLMTILLNHSHYQTPKRQKNCIIESLKD
jgi:hypothetical protein